MTTPESIAALAARIERVMRHCYQGVTGPDRPPEAQRVAALYREYSRHMDFTEAQSRTVCEVLAEMIAAWVEAPES